MTGNLETLCGSPCGLYITSNKCGTVGILGVHEQTDADLLELSSDMESLEKLCKDRQGDTRFGPDHGLVVTPRSCSDTANFMLHAFVFM